MAHVLKGIRDAAKTALTNLTLNSVTIQPFVNRSDDQPLQDSELPAFRIRLRNEDESIESLGVNRIYERRAELVVEGCQKKNATFEDDALELVRLAEVALTSLTGAKAVDITKIEIEDDATGEKPRIVARMTFSVLYYTAIGSPDTAL